MEEWKKIEEYPDYEISNYGRVKSNRTSNSKIISGWETSKGYKRVTLQLDNSSHKELIQRLVAKAFVPNPENKSCVNHIDGDKSNNRADNLDWVTNNENVRHASDCRLNKTNTDKLSPSDIPEIIDRYNSGESASTIAKDYPVSYQAITDIFKGRTWRHISGIEYQWISIKNRLPDNGDIVMIYDSEAVFETKKQRLIYVDLNSHLWKDEVITHWKPKPRAPR